jgi:hypothetical protein
MANDIYCPLDRTKRAMRLLSIDTKFEEIMSCQLHVVEDIEICPEYIAVSYVWGPETPIKTIFLNGVKIDIRMNLYDLLRQLVRDQNGHGAKFAYPYELYEDVINGQLDGILGKQSKIHLAGNITGLMLYALIKHQ